jgi:hypothetical protein
VVIVPDRNIRLGLRVEGLFKQNGRHSIPLARGRVSGGSPAGEAVVIVPDRDILVELPVHERTLAVQVVPLLPEKHVFCVSCASISWKRTIFV